MDQHVKRKQIILIGCVIGFLFFTIMDTGEKRKPLFFNSIIIKIMNNNYHIHHWIIFLVLFLLIIIMIFYNICKYTKIKAFLIGICLGSVIQGLTYNDAFDIRIK
jgi:uncharacterized membrane protein YfhO